MDGEEARESRRRNSLDHRDSRCWERIHHRCCTNDDSPFRRPGYVAGAVFVAFVLLAIVAVIIVLTVNPTSYDARDPNAEDDVPIDYSKALIVGDERDLWALDLDSQQKSLLLETRRGLTAFDLHGRSTIFYREQGSARIDSLSRSFRNLSYGREWEPTGLAVDSVTGKVYALDGLAGTLIVYDATGTGNYGLVMGDLREPVGMAVDVARGLVFIVQKFDSILRMNTDGTSPVKIVTSSSVTAVTVDTQTSRLYWSADSRIHSSDYDGYKRLIIAELPSTPISLGVSGSRLFWVSPVTPASSLRSLWTCKTSSATARCEPTDYFHIPFDDPKLIKVYTGDYVAAAGTTNTATVKNPCAVANGGCDQLCLLRPQADHGCACYLGFRLGRDSRTCSPVGDYLLYARGNFVRGLILTEDVNAATDRESFVEAIAPIRLPSANLADKSSIDFDYNYYTDSFAYSDDGSIGVVSLRSRPTSAPGSRGSYARDRCLKAVAYDWVTNDIYYVRDNCRVAGDTSIVVMKPRESEYYWRTLHTFARGQGHPRSLVVHPNRDCYFFTMRLDERAYVYRVRGPKMSLYAGAPDSDYAYSVNETGLALDHTEDRVYWFSSDGRWLHSGDLDGGRLASVDVSAIREPRQVTLRGRHAYVANATSMWRLDKITGSGLTRLGPRVNDEEDEDDVAQQRRPRPDRLIAGLRIYGQSAQEIGPDNVCAVQNGDCQQFCFRVPRILVNGPNSVNVTDEVQKSCQCDDFRTILGDGKSCGLA